MENTLINRNIQISVIIPYYKNANSINRVLNSIKNQTYQPLEILIINDASPDWEEGKMIIDCFDNLPIKCISHLKNKNGSAARNTGIKRAKGEWIAFLDADDEWTDIHLEHYTQLYLDDKCTLYYCRSLIKSATLEYELPKRGINTNQRASEYLFCKQEFIPTPSMFLSRKLAVKVMFNETLPRHQDYDFIFHLEQEGARIIFSDHLGVIVHWEHNDVEAKGGTYIYSYNWAKNNQSYFTRKSFTCFINKFVVFPLLKKREVIKGLNILVKDGQYLFNTPKEYYFLASMILFGEIRLPWKR